MKRILGLILTLSAILNLQAAPFSEYLKRKDNPAELVSLYRANQASDEQNLVIIEFLINNLHLEDYRYLNNNLIEDKQNLLNQSIQVSFDLISAGVGVGATSAPGSTAVLPPPVPAVAAPTAGAGMALPAASADVVGDSLVAIERQCHDKGMSYSDLIKFKLQQKKDFLVNPIAIAPVSTPSPASSISATPSPTNLPASTLTGPNPVAPKPGMPVVPKPGTAPQPPKPSISIPTAGTPSGTNSLLSALQSDNPMTGLKKVAKSSGGVAAPTTTTAPIATSTPTPSASVKTTPTSVTVSKPASDTTGLSTSVPTGPAFNPADLLKQIQSSGPKLNNPTTTVASAKGQEVYIAPKPNFLTGIQGATLKPVAGGAGAGVSTDAGISINAGAGAPTRPGLTQAEIDRDYPQANDLGQKLLRYLGNLLTTEEQITIANAEDARLRIFAGSAVSDGPTKVVPELLATNMRKPGKILGFAVTTTGNASKGTNAGTGRPALRPAGNRPKPVAKPLDPEVQRYADMLKSGTPDEEILKSLLAPSSNAWGASPYSRKYDLEKLPDARMVDLNNEAILDYILQIKFFQPKSTTDQMNLYDKQTDVKRRLLPYADRSSVHMKLPPMRRRWIEFPNSMDIKELEVMDCFTKEKSIKKRSNRHLDYSTQYDSNNIIYLLDRHDFNCQRDPAGGGDYRVITHSNLTPSIYYNVANYYWTPNGERFFLVYNDGSSKLYEWEHGDEVLQEAAPEPVAEEPQKSEDGDDSDATELAQRKKRVVKQEKGEAYKHFIARKAASVRSADESDKERSEAYIAGMAIEALDSITYDQITEEQVSILQDKEKIKQRLGDILDKNPYDSSTFEKALIYCAIENKLVNKSDPKVIDWQTALENITRSTNNWAEPEDQITEPAALANIVGEVMSRFYLSENELQTIRSENSFIKNINRLLKDSPEYASEFTKAKIHYAIKAKRVNDSNPDVAKWRAALDI